MKKIFCILFLLVLSSYNLYSQSYEERLLISKRVGYEIDAVERNYFGLFPSNREVISIEAFNGLNNVINMIVKYKEGSEIRKSKMIISQDVLKNISIFLDRYEILSHENELGKMVEEENLKKLQFAEPDAFYSLKPEITVVLNDSSRYNNILLLFTKDYVVLTKSEKIYNWRSDTDSLIILKTENISYIENGEKVKINSDSKNIVEYRDELLEYSCFNQDYDSYLRIPPEISTMLLAKDIDLLNNRVIMNDEEYVEHYIVENPKRKKLSMNIHVCSRTDKTPIIARTVYKKDYVSPQTRLFSVESDKSVLNFELEYSDLVGDNSRIGGSISYFPNIYEEEINSSAFGIGAFYEYLILNQVNTYDFSFNGLELGIQLGLDFFTSFSESIIDNYRGNIILESHPENFVSDGPELFFGIGAQLNSRLYITNQFALKFSMIYQFCSTITLDFEDYTSPGWQDISQTPAPPEFFANVKQTYDNTDIDLSYLGFVIGLEYLFDLTE